MKLFAFTLFLVSLAACITLYIVSALKPNTAGAYLLFAIWLLTPYVIMGTALLLLQRKGKVLLHWCVTAIIVSTGGVLFLLDVIFWHSDAQGAIAVLMAPILQGITSALILPIVWWSTRNMHTKPVNHDNASR